MGNCEHEYENANCSNCANGLPCSAYECAKTRGTLKEYVHNKANEINRQKYNEGYSNGYEQGRADAIEEFEKLVFNGTLHQIARMIASGDIPKDLYQKWLSETPIGFMTPIEICREIIDEQLKEQKK